MFGAESTDNLYFSVSAGQLGKGLDEQLARFVAEHPYTKLIIIDTLQKVREVGGDNYSYANDYQIMARLKSFADAHGNAGGIGQGSARPEVISCSQHGNLVVGFAKGRNGTACHIPSRKGWME